MVPQTVPEITPLEFLRAAEAGTPFHLLDVRAPANVASGHIEIIPAPRFHNIPGSALYGMTDLRSTGLEAGEPVVVVCARGNDSKISAALLNSMGAEARSLAGGMEAWMKLSVPRELPRPEELDRLVQVDRVGKGALAYVLVSGGEAMIIDPPRDAAQCVRIAEESGARVRSVADTHIHADYISGAPSLARELRVPYYLHPSDNVYPFDGRQGRLEITPVAGGSEIPLGEGRLRIEHTPGHSPGSVTFILGNECAFTGDFLFLRSVGRPDIADRAEEWSADLWRSIARVRLSWPAGLMVLPAHYGPGTERRPGGGLYDTFGNLLRLNVPLSFSDESGFRSWVRGHSSSVPAAYRTIKAVNLGLRTAGDAEADELEHGMNECAI